MSGPNFLGAGPLLIDSEQNSYFLNGKVGIGKPDPGNKLHVGGGWLEFDLGYGIGFQFATVGGWYRPNYGMAVPHTAALGSSSLEMPMITMLGWS